MKVERTNRGFEIIERLTYGNEPFDAIARLVQQSSAVGRYDDSYDRPGSSFLWIGDHHHLNREEVAELITHLQSWVDTGSLIPKE